MQKDTIRSPAVAGRFYPGEEGELRRDVERYLREGAAEGGPRRAAGVMAPHAGYMFSGGIAGRVFAGVDIPESVVVMGPNHTGRGARIAVAASGAFHLPGVDVPIDAELAAEILRRVPGAEADLEAHRFEHSIEVELPFLVARRPDVKVVPIVLGGLREEDVIAAGEGLYDAVQAIGREVLVVASSDMSHFLPDDVTRKIDRVALKPLLASDPSALYRTVVERDISMCGFIPTTAMLAYARKAKAGAPELVGYATSADASGDRQRVVGYAGVIVPV